MFGPHLLEGTNDPDAVQAQRNTSLFQRPMVAHRGQVLPSDVLEDTHLRGLNCVSTRDIVNRPLDVAGSCLSGAFVVMGTSTGVCVEGTSAQG